MNTETSTPRPLLASEKPVIPSGPRAEDGRWAHIKGRHYDQSILNVGRFYPDTDFVSAAHQAVQTPDVTRVDNQGKRLFFKSFDTPIGVDRHKRPTRWIEVIYDSGKGKPIRTAYPTDEQRVEHLTD